MRLIQIAPTLQYGDAIGNYILAIKRIAAELGYETGIYVDDIHPRITDPDVYLMHQVPKLQPEDILLYHLSIGSALNRTVLQYPCQRVMVYHNITPPDFFMKDAMDKVQACQDGLDDVMFLANKFDFCIADSEFNRQDLISMGYDGDKIAVVPVIVALDDYSQTPDAKRLAELRSDDWVNFLFVGRVAPNKKHEDILRAFAYYKAHINHKARLLLVGNHNAPNNYYDDLVAYVKALNIHDVEFLGHVSFAEILACYAAADVFLCMSEHEGFCVPLLEAMTFDVPIIAYRSTAVTETLGGSGVLLESKNPVYVARVMQQLALDETWRTKVIEAQRKRLDDFRFEPLAERLRTTLQAFVSHAKAQAIAESEEYDTLYDLVESRMESAGARSGFSRTAFRAIADQVPYTADLARLLDMDCPNRDFLEVAYLTFFNRLPEPSVYDSWKQKADTMEGFAFRRALLEVLRTSEECRDRGTKVYFDACHPAPAKSAPAQSSAQR